MKQPWMQQLEIGKLVRRLRYTLQLSQDRFADTLGMTFAAIKCWEGARATPLPLVLQQMETFLSQLGERSETLQTEYSQKASERRRFD